jgi:hypothetical protein
MAVQGGAVYISSDFGTTWTARGSGTPWQTVACSADGTMIVAGTLPALSSQGQLCISTDLGLNWVVRKRGQAWQSVASSADGTRFVGAAWNGPIYTSSPNTTTGTSGYLTGDQLSALDLLYVGGGNWLPLSFVGSVTPY